MRHARLGPLRVGDAFLGESCTRHPVSIGKYLGSIIVVRADILSRYRSVRLDAVHYCEREIYLSAKRKRRSFFDRNGDPEDPTKKRLELFSRTVREVEYLAALVHILKLPYMIRETCKADLARTVSVLPNLRYVDLPEGLYSDDPSSSLLRYELQHKCPDIRKMKYRSGAEESFTMLGHSRPWQNIEILELSGLQIEPDILLYVLSSFSTLQELRLSKISCLEDNIFTASNFLPPFPPLITLALEDCPLVTTHGLTAYLSVVHNKEVLAHLSLSQTGILPQDLHTVLGAAPRLSSLSIIETVSRSFPVTPVPVLSSKSLRILYFEIVPSTNSRNPPSDTYYNYLARSLLSGKLPALKEVYALFPSLPDLLLCTPSAPFVSGDITSRLSTFSMASSIYSTAEPATTFRSPPPLSGLSATLALYTKPAEAPEMEWSVTTIEPPNERNGRRGSAGATRPISLVANQRSQSPHSPVGWNNNNVLVGNGFGGFLAVPSEDGAGRGSPKFGHGRKGSNLSGNEWMG